MMSFRILWTAIFFAFAGMTPSAGVAAADESADSIEVLFEFRYGGIYVGVVTDRLQIFDDGRYRIESIAEPEGAAKLLARGIVRISEGRIDSNLGLRSEKYFYQRGKNPPRTAEFDWKKNQLHLQEEGGESQKISLDESGYDRLSFLYHFYFAQMADADFAVAAESEYQITDGKRAKRYRYRLAESEMAATAMGEIPSVRLVRESGGKRGELWLARNRGFLPLRLITEDRGATLDFSAIAIRED